MRVNILVGLLVSVLICSSGLNLYFYFTTTDRQIRINDVFGQIVLLWAESMQVAGYHLQHANTNIDVRWALELIKAADDIAKTGTKYGSIELLPSLRKTTFFLWNNLFPYMAAPGGNISQAALPMFGTLAQKIWNATTPIILLEVRLRNLEGVNPIQLLEDQGILDDIIDHCVDIQDYSRQMHDFDPKFE
ncbi:MAG: hypothetical protein JSW72_09050 [Candidatus Bathyarchaeota archaeon]|nr:MAG: hypothetical protein JSW72_09050 [Candidatus Bathyarchaeota archaeon]